MKKSIRLIAFSLAIVIFATCLTAFASTLLGDANIDGKINSSDALAVLEYSVGIQLKKFDFDAADINKDGKVDSTDALNILQICVGIPENSNNNSDPLKYSKNQLVIYYNDCLEKSYSYSKFTVEKTERVSINLGKLLLNGQESSFLQENAKKIVKLNEKDTSVSKSFTNGRSSDGQSVRDFVLPTNLTTAGVASHTVTKSGSGYKVMFTLVQERCDFTTMPPHNKACAWPLDFRDINLGGIGEIIDCELHYTGTTIIANVDNNDRIINVQINMPIATNGAKVNALDHEITANVNGIGVFTADFTYLSDQTFTVTHTSATTATSPTISTNDYSQNPVYNAFAIQRKFGFTNAYDNMSGLENFYTDNMRIYFSYDNKDWLIELWKGEYAWDSIGCEIGFYYRESDGKVESCGADNLVYQCVEDENTMYASMELWQYENKNDRKPVHKLTFSRKRCWWAAAFENGVLENHNDRTTLVMKGTIEFPTNAMMELFVGAIEEMGFKEGSTSSYKNVEKYSINGKKVTLIWKNYNGN